MPRKKGGGRSKPRRLEINVSKISIPEGTTRRQYFQTLKRGLREKQLPEGFAIDIAWRNPETKKGRSKDWQQGEWGDVLGESSDGFRKLVTNVIKRYAGEDWGRGRGQAPESVKKQPAAKKSAGKPKKKEQTVAEKRSAAAKKGWETRRKNAAAKKRGKK